MRRRLLYFFYLSFLVSLGFRIHAGTPTFSAAFSPSTIGSGGVSTLTFTLDNTANDVGVSGVSFSNTLPTGMVVANVPNLISTCNGGSVVAAAGGSSIILSGVRLGKGESCTISVNVTGSVPGTLTNTTGSLSTSAGDAGTASSSLTVDASRPSFTMAFSPSTVSLGQSSTLTYTFDNSLNGSNADFLTFSHTLPDGMVLADQPNIVSNANGGLFPNAAVTANPGESSISVQYAYAAAGASATISVDVITTLPQSFTTTTGDLSQNNASPSGPAVATLTVTASSFEKLFVGGAAAPGETVNLQYTIHNLDRSNSYTDITFTDDLNAVLSGLTATVLPADGFCGSGSTVTGSSTITVAGANLVSEASCTFTISVLVPANAAAGDYTSTTSTVNYTAGSATTSTAFSTTLTIVSMPTLTKQYIDDPVTPGQDVTLQYTITNTDTANAASAISFNDFIDGVTPGVVIKTLPAANSCGSGSTFVSGYDGNKRWVQVEKAILAAGGSCTFEVILTIPTDLPLGSFSLPTAIPSATVNSKTLYGNTATDTLIVVAAPKLSMAIVESSASPGQTVNLEFNLSYSANATADATGVGFTVDLNSALSGLASTTATQSDVCGSGSSLSGTSTLTFSGGTMSPGTSCSFSVTLQIPSDAVPGTITATSSTVTATTSGQSVTSATASDTLLISGLTLSKQVIGGPFFAGETATLRYTIANAASGLAATAIQFTDQLNLAMSGLAATSLPSISCGASASITGTTTLNFSGGELQPGESCTFDVTVLVPSNATDGSYISPTEGMSATVNGNNTATAAASAIIEVDSNRLDLTKSFIADPVNPGDTVTLRYAITNLVSKTVSNIKFTDDYGSALSGLTATTLPQSSTFGSGATISGTDKFDLQNGVLTANQGFTFDVILQVPSGSAGGDFVSTSSSLTGTTDRGGVNGDAASDTLNVNTVQFTKTFDGEVFAGDTAVLTYTIKNLDSANSIDSLSFTDDFNAVLSGMAAVSPLPTTPCGADSQLSGTTVLTFQKGSLDKSGECSIAVTVQVPATASAGSYQFSSSNVSSAGLTVATPATASLTVKLPTVSITATDSSAGEHLGTVDTASFQISRDSGVGTLVASLSVNNASTASTTDYNSNLADDITFASGETSKTITLTPVDDSSAEPAETVQLDVASSASYQISGSNASATATIAQNDFGVSNTNDSGEGSLRQAIDNANALEGNPTLDLSGQSGTITLQSTLTLSKDMSIQGPGANTLTISGDKNSSGAANSGDVVVLQINTGVTSTISGISIVKGFSTSKGGGIDNSGTLTINNISVSANAATTNGGGVFSDGTLTINNSTISGNSASSAGGGLYSSSTVTFNSSTVSGNTASSGGGGIESSGTLTITSSTITGNTAGTSGGGINSSGSLSISNSIIVGNTGASDSEVAGTISTDSNNLTSIPSGKTIDNLLNTTLADNGGKTLTHALVQDSPAIDGGSNDSLPADTLDADGDNNTTEQIPLDQRGSGFSRIIGDSADIGAIERQDIVPPTVAIGSPSSTLTTTGPVTFSVTYSGADTVNLTTDKISLNKTGTATGTASVSNETTATPTVTISSISGDGTLGISIASGGSSDAASNTDSGAGPSGTFSVDNTAHTVTINQDTGQSDPATGSPINFQVVFNEAVTGFETGEVTLSGTAGATTGTVSEISPNDGTTYNIAVSGMTSDGTVIAEVPVNVITDTAGNGNAASTSTDNSVAFQPSVSLSIDQTVISENASASTVTATLNTAVGSQVTVNLAFTGTATGPGADYTASTTQIIIPANSLTGTMTVTSVEDSLIEGNESVNVDISSVNNATEDGTQQVTVSITDNDTGSLGFQTATSSPSESAGTASVVVSLSTGDATLAQAVTVDVDDLLTGTASAGGQDYTFTDPSTLTFPSGSGNGTTQSATLTIVSENTVEINETVIFSLTNLSDPTSGSVSIDTTANAHTLTIGEDDVATVAFAAASSSVAEDAAAHTVTVKLTIEGGGTLQDAVAVNVSDAGTGTATSGGTDYAFTTTEVTFAAGSSDGDTQTVTVTQASDNLAEGSEDLDLTVTASSGVATIGTQSTHKATITDSDSATVDFALASSSAAEDGSTHTLNVKLNLSSGVTLQDQAVFNVSDSQSGSASGAGMDYTFTTTPVTFAAGSGNGATQAVTLSQQSDNLVEGSEDVNLTVTVNSGVATVGNQATHKVTLTDSDTATVEFAASSSSVNEDDPAHTVTVNLNISSGVTLAKNAVINVIDAATGTATAGSDYALSTSQVNFSAGSGIGSTQTATVTQVSDELIEGNEDVDLTLAVLSGATTIGTQSTHEVTIIDNDAPIVTADNISITGASGTGSTYKINDTVTATWDNTSSGDNSSSISSVTIDFTQFGGPSASVATNSSDTWTATYTLVAGSIDATGQNISVTAKNIAATTTRADATNATVDNIAPAVTDANISISGASGTSQAFKVGDTLTATWNNAASGENNSDVILSVAVDFSGLGGGAAVTATDSNGTWTAALAITEDGGGVIESSNLNISVTATDDAGNTQTTADTSNAILDNNTPAAPASLDLTTASDTGSSDTDDITNDNTPTITGTAEANSTAELFHSGTTSLGTGTVDGSGNWSITATTVPDGAQSLTAKTTDAAGNVSAASSALSVTIDSGNPTISDIATQTIDEDANTGEVVFTIEDTITAADALTLAASSSDTTLLTDANLVLGGSGTNRTITATPESHKNGSAIVTITVTDVSGNSSNDTFTLAVTPVNDGPDVTTTGGSVAYTENGTAITIDDAVSITDVDDTQMASGSASLTSGFTTGDTLAGTTTGTSITTSYEASTGVLSLTGTDSIENYQTVLQTISYSSTNEDPADISASRTVTFSVTDANAEASGAKTGSATRTVSLASLSDQPVVTTTSGSADYAENGSAVAIASALTLSDPDDTHIASGSVSVSTGFTAGDTLAATTSGTSVSASYDSGTGVLSLSGTDTLANYQSVLQSVTYSSSSEDPTASETARTITFAVTDANSDGAGAHSGSATRGINLTPLNDAPLLVAANPQLTALTEDETGNSGQTIASVVGSSISDVDTGAKEGIAIVSLIAGNGVWQYSVDSGVNWSGIGEVAETSALLLSASDVIRFVPNGQNETAASVTYQAWDQTSGTAGSKSDASSNGTTTAFSTVNDTASIVATAVNDAPTLAGGPFSLPQTTEDTTSAGTLISDILTGLTFGDVDSGAASGIALTAQSGNGAWQYSMDGTDWTVFGALSGNSALLLNSATQVRYVPDEKNAEIGSVTFHAWDQTSGTASTNGSPQTGDTTSNGETSAYSTGSALAEIAITAVNDAPILSPQAPNLGTTDEDTTTAGITISSFVISDTGTADTATGLSDADTGAVRGIALSGQTGNGTWEFSASGTSWTAVGTVSSSAALLLPDSYQLRYVPDNQNEEIPTLAYYGWDQFSGSSESTVDLSGTDATGGTTAFSTATDTASLTVTAVDDAPVLAALPNRSITELSTLTLTATASDVDLPADTLTFSLDSGAPAGAAIDPSTGAFSWTPSESQGPASFEITVRVTDDGTSNLSATQTFTVNVSESNSEPVFGTVTNQVVTEGETMNVVLSASDNDLPANTLTFSLVSPLPGMVVDGSTGIVSWTPGEADGPGTYSIFVQVSDNGTPTLSVRQSFSVTVSESNNAPVIPAIGDQTVKEHETLTLQISASDSDVPANQLSYALSNDAPAGTALDSASGQFSWTPTETQGPGTYTITVQVQDTGSPALTGTQSFQVIVEEVNQAPTLSSFGGNLAFEGAEMQVPLVAFDSDVPAQTITWTLGADAPQGVLLDAGVPALRWTPNEAQGPGTYSFGIEATDDGSPPQNVSSTVTIAVQEINQAPVFATVGPQAVVKGEMLTVDLIATDADLPVQSLTYSLDAGAPSGAAVNETSGQFTWLPAAAATPGSYAITILAADNGTPSQSGTVTINVELTDGNRAPVLAATVTQIVDEGQELNVVLAATDANVPSQNLSYGLGINAPAGVSVDSASGLLSWTPSEEEGPGNYSIEVEVSDDGVPPLTTTGIVNVEVGEVNTAPVLTAIEDQTISEGETLNLTAMATDTDLPGNNLTYSLGTGESAGMAIDTNSGALSWTPEKTQSGAAYDATLIVTDNGTPALQDQKSFVVTVLAVNDPPTIGAISDQATIDGVAVGSIAFEVNDADNSPDSLTVTGASSNTALIPADGILIAGTGINRTVSVQPASGQVGTAAITLEVSDADGATASVSFDVAVEAAAPAITSEFINPAILAGESLILEAQATGTPPLSYQWFFGNAAVDGATQSTFALTNLQVNQAGTYSVEVTNSAGSDLKDVAQVSVNAELGITTEPADLTVIQGETAVFEVIAGGTPPLAHQWNFGGNAIDGATTQTLTLENVQANQAGSYTVDITNAAGSVSSRTALLQVLVPPVIILQPTDTSVIEGGSAAFTAGVSGSQPLTYQWQRNGIDIAGATDSTLALSAVAAADEGTYGVSVSNAGGSIESQAASLTVNVPAQVSDSQQDVVIGVGNPLNLTVDASGTPPFTYQWYLNGTQIDGATEVSFSIAVAQLSDSGEYTVVVTNPVGPIAGPIFNVTVIEAVLIASQPQNVDAKKGDEVRISVGVEGTGPFTYQWELNGAIFSTTSQPELILSGVPLDAAGTYRVRVSNLVSEVLSQDAIVTVTDQAQLTGLPAELVVEVGGELALQVTADGSPPFQYQWQLNGVNISGATTDTFQISNAQSTDGGTYSVTVTDGGGATTSNSTSVIINTPDLGLASDAASASPASASSGDGRGNNLGASPAWMAWNSPGTGIASFSTQGSGFDTLLTVYQGSPDNLTHVASDEDSGGFLTSTTSFNTDTGVTYYVAVDGFKGAQGAIALRWDWVQTSEPLPVITTQPQSQTVLFEQPVAFSVVAESSSGSTLSYPVRYPHLFIHIITYLCTCTLDSYV